MGPKCCKVCTYKYHTQGGGCRNFKKCARWLAWFRLEWAEIRRAAAILKAKEGKK